MIYTAHNTYDGSDGQQLGYAISKDGVNWFKYQAGAIVRPSTLACPDTMAYVGDGLFFEDGGTFYLYYDASNALTANGLLATMNDQ